MKVSFITLSELKKMTYVSGSIDADKVKPYIDLAQEMHIKPYLGSKLFDKIQNLILDDELNLPANADYKHILDEFIKPMTVHYTMVEFMPVSNYTLSNSGVTKNVPTNTELIDSEEAAQLAWRSQNAADVYASRFISYIIHNQSKYPEYNQNSSGDVYPHTDTDFIGWEL